MSLMRGSRPGGLRCSDGVSLAPDERGSRDWSEKAPGSCTLHHAAPAESHEARSGPTTQAEVPQGSDAVPRLRPDPRCSCQHPTLQAAASTFRTLNAPNSSRAHPAMARCGDEPADNQRSCAMQSPATTSAPKNAPRTSDSLPTPRAASPASSLQQLPPNQPGRR